MNKLNIKKSDTVVVISGSDKGKKGKVLEAFPGKERVVVQNIRLVKRHTKPRQQGEPGGIINKEASIHVSDVMLVCPKCNKPTRVGHEIENGKKYRVCKKCNKHID